MVELVSNNNHYITDHLSTYYQQGNGIIIGIQLQVLYVLRHSGPDVYMWMPFKMEGRVNIIDHKSVYKACAHMLSNEGRIFLFECAGNGICRELSNIVEDHFKTISITN